MSPMVAAAAAQVAGLLAGAVLVKSAIDAEQQQEPMAWRQPRCATCNGTGRVACLCSKWSDGDIGCRTCAGSGRRVCSSCGGSGTGRPLPARITIRSENRSSLPP